MGYRYTIHCDGCSKDEPGWNSLPSGWAVVGFTTLSSDGQFTYCPDCWNTMFCSLIKPRAPRDSAGATNAQQGPSED